MGLSDGRLEELMTVMTASPSLMSNPRPSHPCPVPPPGRDDVLHDEQSLQAEQSEYKMASQLSTERDNLRTLLEVGRQDQASSLWRTP